MERQSIVRDAQVTRSDGTYKASFFIEQNIIHANILGSTLLAPVGAVPAELTVQTMLAGQLEARDRRLRSKTGWMSRITPD
jgi:hypothetical protein